MTDLEAISSVVLLAERISCAEVAHLQGITQAAVSQRVSRVEASCGFRIFIRGDHGMVLTEEGRKLLPSAKKLMERAIFLSTTVAREVRKENRCLRFLIDRSVRGDRLAQQLGGLEGHEVERVGPHSDGFRALEAGEVDLVVQGFAGTPDLPPFLYGSELRVEAGACFVWHPGYFDFGPDATLADFLSVPLVIPSESLVPGFTGLLERSVRDARMSADLSSIQCESEALAAELCGNGIGVLFFPGDVVGRLGTRDRHLDARRLLTFTMPAAYRLMLLGRIDDGDPRIGQVLEQFELAPGSEVRIRNRGLEKVEKA